MSEDRNNYKLINSNEIFINRLYACSVMQVIRNNMEDDVPNVTVVTSENGIGNRNSFLDVAICVSLSTNALRKGKGD